jgi:nucleotide-binding universal stress UspA family protein
MDQVVVLCVDGSETSIGAAATGLARLAPGGRTIVLTVVEGSDPTLVTGVSGAAGGTMSPEELTELEDIRLREGEELLHAAAEALSLSDADLHVAMGDPGTEIELYAREVGATVLVVGSRGRGGIKRALLGSVSDRLVRHASCPVLVVRDDVED